MLPPAAANIASAEVLFSVLWLQTDLFQQSDVAALDRERPLGALMLFGAGLYGGFVQAGVGFILIAALAAGMRYDLVRTNALKVVCTAAFSVAALAVFVSTGRVEWVSGIILAVGMTIGAFASVRFALKIDQRVIKWTLLVMVCVTSASVFLFT